MSKERTRLAEEPIESTMTLSADPDGEPAAGSGPVDPAACDLIAKDVSFGYHGGEDPVIEGETLRIPSGSVTALIGPNGSGKSTLLKGLANQVPATGGSVYLDGAEVSSIEPKVLARKLGLLSQENVAPESISVETLIEHGRYPHRGFFDRLTEDDRAAIDRAISLAGIEGLRDREIGSLSGGQKQLVWIAMVLAQETDVLLLDEPTTFLDLHHKLEVMDVIRTLRDDCDITVVVVLHDIERAARLADHVVALKDGAIEACGTPADVVTEDLLASVFGIEAMVARTHHGLQITPMQSLSGWESQDDAA